MQPAQHSLSSGEMSALRPGERAVYRLCIAGEMAEDWHEYLDAVDVSSIVDAEHGSVTLVTCEVLDQAQLMGMLSIMHDWGIMLLWLACVAVPGHPQMPSELTTTRYSSPNQSPLL